MTAKPACGVIESGGPAMETFTAPKQPVPDPSFQVKRRSALAGLTDAMVDKPIVSIINGLNNLPYCFTLQCCWGHFLYAGQNDQSNLDPLPRTTHIDKVRYRIAYIALCIENNGPGKRLCRQLQQLQSIDPDNIQFCCAEWFWQRQVNSYALQVEPDRFKHEDEALLGYSEALHLETVRNRFFVQLKKLLEALNADTACG